TLRVKRWTRSMPPSSPEKRLEALREFWWPVSPPALDFFSARAGAVSERSCSAFPACSGNGRSASFVRFLAVPKRQAFTTRRRCGTRCTEWWISISSCRWSSWQGKSYWDGGLSSVTALAHLLNDVRDTNMLIFQIHLFAAASRLPQNMAE